MIRCLHLSVLPPFVHLSFTASSRFYILPAPLSPCKLGCSILSVPGCSFSKCKTIRSIVLASPTAVYSSFFAIFNLLIYKLCVSSSTPSLFYISLHFFVCLYHHGLASLQAGLLSFQVQVESSMFG